MNIENRELSQNLINSIEELRKSINTISVYDFNIYSSMELYYTIANKLNELIKECYRYEVAVSEEVVKQNECLQYLLNEGLNTEVANKINNMLAEGVFENLIDDNILPTFQNEIKNKEDKINSISQIPKTLSKLESSDEDVVIIVAGDSIVHGRKNNVKDEDTYTYKLAQMIANKYSYANVVAVCGNTTDNSENRPIDSWDETVIQTSKRKQTVYVVRSGVGGDTLLRLYRRINDITSYKGRKADLVILHEGINDSLSDDFSKYVPTDRYYVGYCSLIQYLKRELECELVICTSHWFGSLGDGQSYVYMQKRAGITEKCQVIDLYDIWQKHYNSKDGTTSGQGEWLFDGSSDKLHCTPTGYLEGIAKPIFDELFVYNQKLIDVSVEKLNLIKYDNPLINYRGVWDTHEIKDNRNNILYTMKVTDKTKATTGNYLIAEIYGNNIYLLTRKGLGLGSCKIYVDGVEVREELLYTPYPTSTSDVTDVAICSYFFERIKIVNNSQTDKHIIKIEQISDGLVPFYGFETDLKKVDEKIINSGVITVTGTGTSYATAEITFEKRHKTYPIIVANANSKDYIIATAQPDGTTSATLYVGKRDGSNFSNEIKVNWISIDS